MTSKSRKARLALAMVLALSPGLAREARAQDTKLSFAGSVTWYGQIPIMVAIEKNFFKEQGIEIVARLSGTNEGWHFAMISK